MKGNIFISKLLLAVLVSMQAFGCIYAQDSGFIVKKKWFANYTNEI